MVGNEGYLQCLGRAWLGTISGFAMVGSRPASL